MNQKPLPYFQPIRDTLESMIPISKDELHQFLSQTYPAKFKRNELLSKPNTRPNSIYFINKGLIRVFLTDQAGTEHTIHFALENQFIADYTHFLQNTPSQYALQALEDLEIVEIPREAINWGYKNLDNGQMLGRLIAEFYFIYQDNRIKNQYIRTPKERYDTITEVFPNLHNRVPQHMIASYLGITSIHLSRLKKMDLHKV